MSNERIIFMGTSQISEMYLKETGTSKGRLGSMHLNDMSAGISASIPIVASSIPIAVGIALSIKMKKENRIHKKKSSVRWYLRRLAK